MRKNVRKIIDLGTGNGVIPLFLSKRTDATIYGIEIQKVSYELALRNIELNGLNSKIVVFHDDMKNYTKYFKRGSMDIVVSNPPFFKVDGDKSYLNTLPQLTLARHEIEITLDDLVQVASELLKDKGYFYLVHRVDRLADIFYSFRANNLEIKKLRFCYTTENKNAKIILVEAVKNGKSGLKILSPLIINKPNGEYTEEVLKMFT